MKLAKSIYWREHIKLDKCIMANNSLDNPSVTCINCDLVIGHPSILEHTNYECPRCGFKYKGRKEQI